MQNINSPMQGGRETKQIESAFPQRKRKGKKKKKVRFQSMVEWAEAQQGIPNGNDDETGVERTTPYDSNGKAGFTS